MEGTERDHRPFSGIVGPVRVNVLSVSPSYGLLSRCNDCNQLATLW